jgi:hypothetical protein
MTEIWKTIDNYETYSVSSFGRVNNNNAGKLLKGSKHLQGYLQVILCKNGERKSFLIHRLVAIAFIPNPENKEMVDHHDNNPSNNSLKNLRWATCSENMRNQQITSNNTSGVKGVSWNKQCSKWQARIKFDGKQIHLGLFSTIEEASLVRATRANELFGIFTNVCELAH